MKRKEKLILGLRRLGVDDRKIDHFRDKKAKKGWLTAPLRLKWEIIFLADNTGKKWALLRELLEPILPLMQDMRGDAVMENLHRASKGDTKIDWGVIYLGANKAHDEASEDYDSRREGGGNKSNALAAASNAALAVTDTIKDRSEWKRKGQEKLWKIDHLNGALTGIMTETWDIMHTACYYMIDSLGPDKYLAGRTEESIRDAKWQEIDEITVKHYPVELILTLLEDVK